MSDVVAYREDVFKSMPVGEPISVRELVEQMFPDAKDYERTPIAAKTYTAMLRLSKWDRVEKVVVAKDVKWRRKE